MITAQQAAIANLLMNSKVPLMSSEITADLKDVSGRTVRGHLFSFAQEGVVRATQTQPRLYSWQAKGNPAYDEAMREAIAVMLQRDELAG